MTLRLRKGALALRKVSSDPRTRTDFPTPQRSPRFSKSQFGPADPNCLRVAFVATRAASPGHCPSQVLRNLLDLSYGSGVRSPSMNPLERAFENLDRWRHFPAYQLERRVDIFFSIYLKGLVEELTGVALEDEILPELPIKRDLIWTEHPTHKSVKIDYALAAARPSDGGDLTHASSSRVSPQSAAPTPPRPPLRGAKRQLGAAHAASPPRSPQP
jgi:hypothetical protein